MYSVLQCYTIGGKQRAGQTPVKCYIIFNPVDPNAPGGNQRAGQTALKCILCYNVLHKCYNVLQCSAPWIPMYLVKMLTKGKFDREKRKNR